MRKYLSGLALSAAAVLVAASGASAHGGGDKAWVCHQTGSQSNPYVLLYVPTNSAHFTSHEGDVAPVDGQCPTPAPTPGTPGENGAPGPAGPAGPAGVPGAPGATTTVTVIERVPVAAPKACVSHRRFHVKLPRDLRGLKKVRVNFAGSVKTMKVTKGGRILLDFRGHRCGQYAVAIHKKGHKAVKLLYTLGGEKNGGGNLTAFNVPPQRAPTPDPAPSR